jgi:hypothetical protein
MIDRVTEPLQAAATLACFELSIRKGRSPLRSTRENEAAACDGRSDAGPVRMGRNNSWVP